MRGISSRSLAGVGFVVLFVLGAEATMAGCTETTCADSSTCAAPLGSTGDGGPTGDSGGPRVYPDVPPPSGCDPTVDPALSLACLADSYALFVDGTSGLDTNPGTRAAPLKTIAAAMDNDRLAGRPRVYVCAQQNAAPYDEVVVVHPRVTVVGGFACGTWTRSPGLKTTIAPSDSTRHEVAVRIEGSSGQGVTFSDFVVRAASASIQGRSSVAMFIVSSNVTLRRVELSAEDGREAPAASATPANDASDKSGAPASGAAGGAARDCACLVGSTRGGKGGDATLMGESGQANPAVAIVGVRTGMGGTGSSMSGQCVNGAGGSDGFPGRGGFESRTVGELSAQGFTPSAGGAGDPGGPGSGGGGGGGAAGMGGGGGACGGCGGVGGLGGPGGGASIALMMFESTVSVIDSSLTSKNGGTGGPGARGGDATPGGAGSVTGACAGGDGGNGSGGGGGAGGAGGISTTILRKGGTLTRENTVLSRGLGGTGGEGGQPGSGTLNSLGASKAGVVGAKGLTVLDVGEELVLP